MKIQNKRFKILFLIVLFLACANITQITVIEDYTNTNTYELRDNPKISGISLNQAWLNTWAMDPQNFFDYGEAVAIDSNNNVYVVGYSLNYTDKINLPTSGFLVKYDKNGNFKWSKTWSGGDDAKCHDLVIDYSDNVYVIGTIYSGNIGYLNVLKFNNSGGMEWNTTWNQDNSYGSSITLGLDNYLNAVGINGTSISGPDPEYNICLLKLNKTNGIIELKEIYKSPEKIIETRDIAVDSKNNIYIVGSIGPALATDIFLLKYNNSTGSFEWIEIWNNGAGITDDAGNGVAIDKKDNIYVVGINATGSDSDLIIFKYNTSGDLQWESFYKFSSGLDGGNDIAIDLNGDIYIAGHEREIDIVIMKIDNNRTQLWNTKFGGYDDDMVKGLVVSNLSDIIITGHTWSYGTPKKPDMFVGKYNFKTPPISGGGDDDDDDDDTSAIAGFDISLMIAVICIISVFYIRKSIKNR